MDKRVFLIICDSMGIGKAPDAEAFGDAGTDTLRALNSSPEFDVPVLESLGLFNIEGVDYREGTDRPLASYARAEERSMGKDTTTGHFEMIGIHTAKPMPTYPNGFPQDLLDDLFFNNWRRVVGD